MYINWLVKGKIFIGNHDFDHQISGFLVKIFPLSNPMTHEWIEDHPLLWESNLCFDNATIWMEWWPAMWKPGSLVIFARPKCPDLDHLKFTALKNHQPPKSHKLAMHKFSIENQSENVPVFLGGNPTTHHCSFNLCPWGPREKQPGMWRPDTSRSQKPKVKINTARIRRASSQRWTSGGSVAIKPLGKYGKIRTSPEYCLEALSGMRCCPKVWEFWFCWAILPFCPQQSPGEGGKKHQSFQEQVCSMHVKLEALGSGSSFVSVWNRLPPVLPVDCHFPILCPQ